ncbi:MAG: DUF2911 domain-containing protein [Flavobacteriales bacterium]
MIERALFPLAAALLSTAILAQDLPQPSPKGEVEQVIGLTKVEVGYSRPAVRGRAIFGGLLPYGKLWRTGANAATTVEFSGPVSINGSKLEAGKYSLFTIPEKGAWTVIFNKNTSASEGDYKESDDALRVKADPKESEFTESMTIGFDEVKDDMARMDIRWERTRVSVTISAPATEQALANIKEALAKPDAKFNAYNGAARFCVDRGLMPKEALAWAQKSVSMEEKYWNTHTLALVQAANGLKKEAIATAQKSMALAEKEGNTAFVDLNKAKIAEWSQGK